MKKGLIRGTKAETLSGTVVQTFRNPQNIAVPNLPEVDPLGQIFANESVRVDKETKRPTQLTSFAGRLLISFVPRSQGLWGWAKYTGTPKAADTSLCRANSFPLSVVRVRHSIPSSRRIRAVWTADAVLSSIFAANSKRVLRSTTVTSPPVPGLPRTVSISQFPISSLCSTSLGRSSMETASLI